MTKDKRKLLVDMFLAENEKEKLFRNMTDGEYFIKYTNENFDIRRNLFYNTLHAVKYKPSHPQYPSSNLDIDQQRLIKRFYFKPIVPIALILIVGLLYIISQPTSVFGKLLGDYIFILKSFVVPMLTTYFLIFIYDRIINRKIFKKFKDIKNAMLDNAQHIENSKDNEFVDELINNNIAYYRKLKLDRLNKNAGSRC